MTCLSKLAYVVAELKQNLPLDHAGTVLVTVNEHLPFVHQRLVQKLHQHRQLDSQAVVQISEKEHGYSPPQRLVLWIGKGNKWTKHSSAGEHNQQVSPDIVQCSYPVPRSALVSGW